MADADIDRQKAERIATEIFDAIHDKVATKQDLQRVEADLQRIEAALRADLQRIEAALKADMQVLKAELETRITQVEHRLITLGVRALVVAVGIVLAAIRYLPPASHG